MAEKGTARFEPQEMVKMTEQFLAQTPLFAMVAPQLQQYWTTQEKILLDLEKLSRAWFDRRQRMARAALETTGKMSNGDVDASKAAQVMGEWLSESMAHLSEDAKDGYEFSVRCMEHVINGASATKKAREKAA